MKFTRVESSAEDAIGSIRHRPTEHQLSALASLHRDVRTKKHARLILRRNEFCGSDAEVERLQQRVKEIAHAHDRRVLRHVEQRLGQPYTTLPKPSGRAAVLLPTGSVMDRLEEAKNRAVIKEARHCFRFGAAGGGSFNVRLTKTPEAVGYDVSVDTNYTTYRGSFKGWAAREDHHQICIPTDWRTRVLRRGLASPGGLLTLDLHPLLGFENVELFQAVWARQSRGYSVRVERGVIARLGDVVFHAVDIEQAIKGLKQKIKRLTSDLQDSFHDYSLSIEEFIQRYASFGDLQVCFQDAVATGACDFGIRAWCAAVDIDLQLGQVPLSRLLECFRIRPQMEVRATVLHVVRRHRSTGISTE